MLTVNTVDGLSSEKSWNLHIPQLMSLNRNQESVITKNIEIMVPDLQAHNKVITPTKKAAK